MPHFSGHYRLQEGGVGVVDLGIGLVAIPLARKFLVSGAKGFGKEVLNQAAPKLINVATSKEKSKQALKTQ